MSALIRIAAFLAAAALAPAALAAEASMDKADVVWMLVSTTLVLFMTIPGIALFYGGFWGAVFLKRMAGWDDSLDAFGVHGVGGIVGALLTGVFASSAVTGSEMNPVMTQVGIQAASVVATMVYASAVSWILLKIIDVVMGLRVTSDEERMGLDLSLHGERIE